MGTELIRRLEIKSHTPFSAASINLSNPNIVKEIHLDYLKAGADIITTNTFTANERMQAYYGYEHEVKEQNQKGMQLAREAVLAHWKQTGKKALIGANIGPIPFLKKDQLNKTKTDLINIYKRQVNALVKEKPNIVIVECAYHLETLSAIGTLLKDAMNEVGERIPVMVTVPIYKQPSMIDGLRIDLFFEEVEKMLHPELVGFTCGEGLDNIEEALEKMPQKPLVLVPNAGLPDECGNYTMDIHQLINRVIELKEKYSIAVVGGCCGTTPHYIGQLKEALEEEK